jgi:LAO/AO transport system kinase
VVRAEAEIEAVAVTRLRARIRDAHGASLPDLAKRVVAGELDAYAAADELQPGLVEPG